MFNGPSSSWRFSRSFLDSNNWNNAKLCCCFITSFIVWMGWFIFYIEDCAWIVTALLHLGTIFNFLLVLTIVLLGFAFFFHNLQNGVSDCEPNDCYGHFADIPTAFKRYLILEFLAVLTMNILRKNRHTIQRLQWSWICFCLLLWQWFP